jgi:hypothetical protein
LGTYLPQLPIKHLKESDGVPKEKIIQKIEKIQNRNAEAATRHVT